MIKVENLTKTYFQGKSPVKVLVNLDFHLEETEIVTILGRSGSGKSTLLDLIMGLTEPTTGKIIRKPGINIGYVFQRPALLPWRSVLRNVSLPLEIEGLPKAECKDRARIALSEVGMNYAADAYPFQLSGGMAQRVAIARALIQSPDLLLMDEPFGALDPILRDNLNVNLIKLWARTRKTILFVTHSINEALILSDRIVILEEGRFILESEVDLPKPRDFETFHTPEFAAMARRLREHLPIQPNLPRTVVS